jgi:predicted component of type VI protein secretion system
MYQVARYLGASGSYAVALAVQRQVVRAREETLGAEHPDTLTARANLADWTGQAARDQYAALLPVFERVCGAEHPQTRTARGNLARWTKLAQNPG